jgi:hypothetical protein
MFVDRIKVFARGGRGCVNFVVLSSWAERRISHGVIDHTV